MTFQIVVSGEAKDATQLNSNDEPARVRDLVEQLRSDLEAAGLAVNVCTVNREVVNLGPHRLGLVRDRAAVGDIAADRDAQLSRGDRDANLTQAQRDARDAPLTQAQRDARDAHPLQTQRDASLGQVERAGQISRAEAKKTAK